MNLQIDWQQYWLDFKEAHGGDPVPYLGRLLFSDGWMYSASDLKGPEWGPPEDPRELHRLKVAYWQIRHGVVKQERDALRQLVKGLRETQAQRSVPLKHAKWIKDEEGEAVQVRLGVTEYLNDLQAGRLDWLERDCVKCVEMLEQLNPTERAA